MRKFITIILALGLTACATIPNPITKSRVDILDAGWGSTLSLADGYYDACDKRLIPPDCRTNVAKMQKIAPLVEAKVVKAREYAKNPSISAVDLIDVASDAVNDFKLLIPNWNK